MINILLNGYSGNMGTALSNYIQNSNNFKILYGIDRQNSHLFNTIRKKPDVIIDFSTPSSTFIALNYAIENLIPIVIATTGFSQKQESKISEYSEAIPIFKSSNMSYGITVLSNIIAQLAQRFENADIEILEKHHKRKKDAPSGTALMIADAINKKCNNKYTYILNRNIPKNITETSSVSDEKDLSHEIGFASVRGGNLVGEHTVFFFGKNESIEITHTAYSRNIYIEGVLHAAEFIITKKNGLFNMYDLCS